MKENFESLSELICLDACAGAGLGRLCLELTNLGFEVQGNEFSYYMLLTSSFILNNSQRAQQWTVFPWMHSNCNQKSVADQLRGVRFLQHVYWTDQGALLESSPMHHVPGPTKVHYWTGILLQLVFHSLHPGGSRPMCTVGECCKSPYDRVATFS